MSMLSTPDYSLPYMPKKESVDFFNFVNLVLGDMDNVTPKTHYMLIDHMFTRHQNQQSLCHRGMGKSAVMSMMAPLYVAAMGGVPNFGVVHNLVLFSATITQAEEHLANMRALYEKSESLQSYVTLVDNKRIRPKNNQLVFDNNHGNRIYIQAKGSGESMRGTRKEDIRPQLLIFDDIMVDEILTSELERKKLKSWFYSAVSNAVDITHYKFWVIGTPMTQADLLWDMKNSKEWHTLMLPVAHEFPIAEDKLISSWPDRFTPKRIYDKYREASSMGADGEFFREMMLNVMPQETRVFQDNWFKTYKKGDVKFANMNSFTTMDLAVSVKQSADFTVILTISVGDDDTWFVRQIDVERMDPSRTMDTLFQHIRLYRPIQMKAEKAALQQVFDHYIQRRMVKENTYVMYNPLELNSKLSKHERILSLHNKFKTGKIFFPEHESIDGMAELLYELKGYTQEGATTKHDDAVDCLANFMDPNFLISTQATYMPSGDEEYIPMDMVKDSAIF